MSTITVFIYLSESSQPLKYEKVINTYQKGDLFCIYCEGETVYKFPINSIFRIVEDYGSH